MMMHKQPIFIFIFLLALSTLLTIAFYFRNERFSLSFVLFKQSRTDVLKTDASIAETGRARIDLKYCGGSCRFINLLHIVEQETRAQLHLRHLAFTAGLVDRTFVLPNVANSRIGACHHYDFEYYYDIQWAKNNSEHFQYITMQDFKSWLQERKEAGVPASDQIMSIYDTRTTPNPKPQEQTINHCLSEYTKPQSMFNKVMAWNVKAKLEKVGESQLVQFLRGPLISDTSYENDGIEILHIELSRGNPFSHNPAAAKPISYSQDLIKLADETSEKLGSFIAVHWRMETVRKTQNLVKCAENLVTMLDEDPKFQGHNVFLLTDYPHSFSESQQELAIEEHADIEDLSQWLQSTSSTFHLSNFTPDHHRAIKYLYKHHRFTLFETKVQTKRQGDPIENWNLLPIPAHLQKPSLHGTGNLIDEGWLGILDKLMAIRSRYFLAGRGKRVCARTSTFTLQIAEERDNLGMPDAAIEYFGKL